MKTRVTFAAFTFVALFAFSAPLHANLGNDTWTGNSTTTSGWSDPANWTGDNTPPQSDDNLFFAGNKRTMNFNDNSTGSVASVTFNSGAAAFTLTGNFIGFFNSDGSNTITNNSTNLQTLSFFDPGIS